MLLSDIATTSAAVGDTRSRLAKVATLAACLRAARPDEVAVAVAYLSGEVPQGAIGIGWATLRAVPPPADPPPTLELLEVDSALTSIGRLAGRGSQVARREAVAALFARATEIEHRFLVGLLSGELRQGALEGVMVEAIASAAGASGGAVRRAAMLSGDLGVVAAAAMADGGAGLARFRMRVLQPLQPMLAQTAPDVDTALQRIHPAAVEWKLDGARVQVHRLGRDVRAFTRNLADVTARVPEVVEVVSALAVDAAVLDGEVIALRDGGRPHPFQVTMSRFGSKLDVERGRDALPLSLFVFDCLHVDGDDIFDRRGSERFAILSERLPAALVVPRIVADAADDARAFLDRALERGHEGVMVKSLDAPYEAGRRGAGWLKVKRAHTLDLVVLAAEWGHGRRRGWLSNLHLGARDARGGGYVMLGKTFKGMTDEMLAFQTERLLELETQREGIVVYVRPEMVVEVAFDGLQKSSRYPGGLALRFARVKGYRPDKRPEDADTIDTVRALFGGA